MLLVQKIGIRTRIDTPLWRKIHNTGMNEEIILTKFKISHNALRFTPHTKHLEQFTK